ncbi:MAG: hypothetical protein J0L64_27750 [Acidobacteria bacterium]|nr:hypothetical protein [Acidobacteriota bacterium]
MPRLRPWPLAFTLLYIALALFVIHDDRTYTGHNWISLDGMPSFLATFPISAPADALLHLRLNHRSNLHMAIAVLGTAALIYFVLAALARLTQRFLAAR